MDGVGEKFITFFATIVENVVDCTVYTYSDMWIQKTQLMQMDPRMVGVLVTLSK